MGGHAMRISHAALTMLLFFPSGIAVAGRQAQQQDDSLAAAARHAREQKKTQSKPAKVWDNDNIPRSPGDLSVVGKNDTASNGTAAPSDNAQDPAATASTAAKPG